MVLAAGLLRITHLHEVAGLRLIGQVDLTCLDTLALALRRLADTADEEDLHLDLAELSFIDVGGTRLLVQVAAWIGPERRLVLHDPPPTLVRILSLGWTALDNLTVDAR